MNPTERPGDQQNTQPDIKRQVTVENEPAGSGSGGRLFLFHYVTMLFSGLILLGLMSFVGYALFDHWLGEPDEAGFFADFAYYGYLYLLVSFVLFGGLHIWMRMLTGKVEQDDYPSGVRVFRAIFLTILAVTILSGVGMIIYVVMDMLLGTGNYSAKSMWLVILDALQMMAWAALLWWYFKQPRAAALYNIATLVIIGVAATLLLIFPILSRRDAVIDSRTSGDLTAISSAVGEYAQKNDKLPANLREVKLDDKVASRVGQYEYEVTQSPTPNPVADDENFLYKSIGSSFSYKLCANFKTDTTKKEEDKTMLALFSASGMAQHPSGRHCFDQTAYGKHTGSDSSPARPSQESLDMLMNSASSY